MRELVYTKKLGLVFLRTKISCEVNGATTVDGGWVGSIYVIALHLNINGAYNNYHAMH
jgi:hypothetical protein